MTSPTAPLESTKITDNLAMPALAEGSDPAAPAPAVAKVSVTAAGDVATQAASNPDAPAPETAIPWRRYLWPGLAALIVFGALAYLLGPVLSPFVMGAMAAYVASPLVERLEQWRVPRALGALLTLLLGVSIIVGLVFIVVPLVQQEAQIIASRLPALGDKLTTVWKPKLEAQFGIQINFDFAQIPAWLKENFQSAGAVAGKVAQSLHLGGLALLGFVVNLMLAPVVVFYLLKDWPKLTHALSELVPRGMAGSFGRLLGDIDRVMAEYLRGQFLVMLCLVFYYCVGLKLVGLEFWLPVGVITGLLVVVPYLGFGLGLILAMVAAMIQFADWHVWAVLAVYGLGQIIEGFGLTPFLVGERVGLHPLAVLFALMAFGQLFGFFGVLIAVPAGAALLIALRYAKATYQRSSLYNEGAWNNSSST